MSSCLADLLREADSAAAVVAAFGARLVPVGVGAGVAFDLRPDAPAPVFVCEGLGAPSPGVMQAVATALAGAAAPAAGIGVFGGQLAVFARSGMGRPVLHVASRRAMEPWLDDIWQAFGEPSGVSTVPRVHRLLLRQDVGAAFFRAVRTELLAVRAAWVGLASDTETVRQSLAMTLLCRVMFVYFIERRGWIPEGTVAGLVLGASPERALDRLRAEVFAPLNTPEAERTALSALPYLNGGLFDASAAERANPGAALPDDVLRGLVLRALEPFRFVPSECTDDVAVDPEMLGRVFEGLMAEEDRSCSGTFYTPPRLVRQTVEDALRTWLGAGILDALDDARAPAPVGALDRLRAVRVLDPAAGSGAFVLGCAHRLAALRARCSGGPLEAELRDVLATSVFGVDTSETAVTICTLRLWLSLVAVSGGPAPLPNLGRTIRRGDALLDGARGRPSGVAMERLRALTSAYVCAHGAEKRALEVALRAEEQAVAREVWDAARRDVARQRAALVSNGDLFAGASAARAVRAERERLDARGVALDDALRRIEAGEGAVGFDFDVHFGQVLAEGGFTLIVGNPPWVRLSRVPEASRRALRSRYRWMTGLAAGSGAPCEFVTLEGSGRGERPDGSGFGVQPDLSVAFVERSVELLAPRGVLAFVVPAKLLTAGYGGALRAGLLAEAPPVLLRDLSLGGENQFTADVLPAVIVARRGAVERTEVIEGARSFSCAPEGLSEEAGGPWLVLAADARGALTRLSAGPRLHERYALRLGVKTGLNAAFIGGSETPESVDCVRGADISAFHVKRGGRMLFAHDRTHGAPLSRVSDAARERLAPFAEALARRADRARSGPHEVFRVGPGAVGHRVVFRDIGVRLEAVRLAPVADGGPVALNSCYIVAVAGAAEARRLAAWLNAPPARFVAAARSDRALGGYRRFQARNVGQVPLPPQVEYGHVRWQQLADRLDDDPDDAAAREELGELAASFVGLDAADVAAIRRSRLT